MRSPAATQKLLESAASKDLAGFTRAMRSGADVLAKDLSGYNALALSLIHGPEDLALVVFGVLLKASPDMDWLFDPVVGSKTNALGLMVSHHRYRVLSTVLGAGEEIVGRIEKFSFHSGETIAHLAVREDAPRALSLLLKACPSLARARPNGECALALAVRLDNEKIAELMIAAGADVLGSDSPPWAWVESVAMVDLLAKEVDWERVLTSDGRSITHVLAARGPKLKGTLWRAIRHRLRNQTCAVDASGHTPLHLAIQAGAAAEVIDELLDSGARWDDKNKEGDTAGLFLEQQVSNGWELPNALVERWKAMAQAQCLDRGLELVNSHKQPVRF